MVTSTLGRPTFGGLASGLDTNALLEGLLALERQPLQRIQTRRGEINQQRTLMRELNTKVMALRDAAQAIDNRNSGDSGFSLDEEFLRYSGSSENEDVVTVSAQSGASPGDIEVEVVQLARGSRRFSETLTATEADAALAVGQQITISLPNADPDAVPPVEATSIQIPPGGGGAESNISLLDIRDQINTSADNGGKIRADVLQISDDAFQLVLTTTGTGATNELSVTGDLAIQAVDLLDPDDPDVAREAQVRIFDQLISRDSNNIDDVLTGITLSIEGLNLDPDTGDRITDPVTVRVDVDTDEVAAGIETFVKAYNEVVSFIEDQSRYNETTNSSGPLSGDFTLRDIQRQLREIVSSGFSFERNPNNPFAPSGEDAQGGSIALIGIELEGGGELSLNRDTLDEALALDPLSVRQFLTGATRVTDANPDPEVEDFYDEGFAQRIASQLEGIVRSSDGALAIRDQGYADRLKEFDNSISRFEQRLGQREETLVARFSELERIVSSLQSQQGFLTSL